MSLTYVLASSEVKLKYFIFLKTESGSINLKSKTIILVLGVLLILIALILGAVQHFVHNIYGAAGNKWYFYGLVVIIALIGLILAVWSLMKSEAPAKTTQGRKETLKSAS